MIKKTSKDQNDRFWKRSHYSESYTVDLDDSSSSFHVFLPFYRTTMTNCEMFFITK